LRKTSPAPRLFGMSTALYIESPVRGPNAGGVFVSE
jgi:hypothetical protein